MGNITTYVFLFLIACVFWFGEGSNPKRSDDDNPLLIVVDKLSRDLLTVKAQLDAQQHDIDALKAARDRTVAFSAYVSDEPHVNAAEGSSVPFRGVMANIGGGYNAVTSAFTAPVAGPYFFIVHVDCSTDFRALSVVRNSDVIFFADNDAGDGHVTGSGLVTLQQGDVVTTRYYSNAGFVDAGSESTFAGFLVK